MPTSDNDLVQDAQFHNSDPEIKGNFPLDAAVVESKATSKSTTAAAAPRPQSTTLTSPIELPPGTKIVTADRYNSSLWTVTARISTILADGTPKLFFLKCATEDSGRMMLEGEFHSMTELYKTMPSFVPEPYAWGKFQTTNPETYFFLCQFIKMSNTMPDAIQFSSRVAKLHKLSKSPNNCFGFHVTTNQGKFPQVVEWDPSWQSFFAKMLRHSIQIDAQENGHWAELDRISSLTITSVIPLLLGPLESDGRVVKPSLIHGDLWDGNIGTECGTGDVYIFDAGAYYAHNEMELGMWRCRRHEFVNKEIYLSEYLKNAGTSEPVEQFDDRNRLYCVYMNIWASAHHAGGIDRETAYNDMCFLVNKYSPELE